AGHGVAKRGGRGEERAAVDGMVRIAFDVHHAGLHVLRLVAERMDDHAAGNGAVRASASRLRGPGDLQFAHFRARLPEIEPECDCSADRCCRTLQEGPALHGLAPCWKKRAKPAPQRPILSISAYFLRASVPMSTGTHRL